MAASPDRATALSSPSHVASTSAVTLDRSVPAGNGDEDAELFASLVNGIQNGATATASEEAVATENPPSMSLSAPVPSDFSAETSGFGDGTRSIEEPPSAPIQAYAKLEFPGFSYYIQTLDFTIGRRPAEFRAKTADEQHITGTSKINGDVDVDLGPLKSISRFHVRVFYQDQPAPPVWGSDMSVFPSGLQDGMGGYGMRTGSMSSTRASPSNDEERFGSHAQGRFVLQVLGRNGACVDDVYVGKGAIVPLGKRTKIQIAERVFYFVLPPSHPYATGGGAQEGESDASLGTSDEEADAGEDGSGQGSLAGSLGGGSSEEESEDEESLATPTARRKLVLKRPGQKAAEGRAGQGKGKVRGKGAEAMETGKEEEAITQAEQKQIAETFSIANRKRKRGEPLDEVEQKALKVGTPIGVEALNLHKKKKKVDPVTAATGGETQTGTSSQPGRGKGAGKAAIVSAAMAAKAKADAEAIQAAAEAQVPMQVDSVTAPSNGLGLSPVAPAAAPPTTTLGAQSTVPATGLAHNTLPASPSQAPAQTAITGEGATTSASDTPGAAAATPSGKKPLPPAGPGVKPDKSNMELIREAMSGPVATSRGGKLALQEVYEYLTSTYEWFRNNSRANGRDWHSAIRHAIGSAKDMVRIQRKPNESGKGVFYAFASSEAAKAAEAEQGDQPDVAGQVASPTPPPPLATSQTVASVTASPVPTPKAAPAPAPAPAPAASSPAPKSASPLPTPSTPTTPSIAPDGRVRIVVGKAPPEALAQMAAAPKAAITQSIEALFGGPPIVHHEGTLFLSPIVFGRMSPQEISDIGGKGAQQALATLQAQLVAHLQSKMTGGASSPSPQPPVRPSASSSPSPGLGRPPLAASAPRPVSSAVLGKPVQRPALPRPAQAGSTVGRPPVHPRPSTSTVASRPPGSTAAVSATGVRPGVPANAALGRPTSTLGPTLPTARPVGRPPLNQAARSVTSTAIGRPPATGRPGRPPLHPRPATQPPSATIARPGATSASTSGAVRPSGSVPPSAVQGQPPSQANSVRPSTSTPATGTAGVRPGLPTPGATTAGRPPLPRPALTATGSRPGPGRPPLTAQRPAGQASPRPGAPSVPRPGPGRPPLSARPRPAAPPGQQVGRPPSVAIGQQAGLARPASAASTVTGASRPPSASAGAAARPATATPSSATSSARPAALPASSAVPSASSATASTALPVQSSNSEMAQLLALLAGGKLDSGKLTPAQHELLQRAGRLAAEQQKAQQQKAAAVTNGTQGSPAPASMATSSKPAAAAVPSPRPVARPAVSDTPPKNYSTPARPPNSGPPMPTVRPAVSATAVTPSGRPAPIARPPTPQGGTAGRPITPSPGTTAERPVPNNPSPAPASSSVSTPATTLQPASASPVQPGTSSPPPPPASPSAAAIPSAGPQSKSNE